MESVLAAYFKSHKMLIFFDLVNATSGNPLKKQSNMEKALSTKVITTAMFVIKQLKATLNVLTVRE